MAYPKLPGLTKKRKSRILVVNAFVTLLLALSALAGMSPLGSKCNTRETRYIDLSSTQQLLCNVSLEKQGALVEKYGPACSELQKANFNYSCDRLFQIATADWETCTMVACKFSHPNAAQNCTRTTIDSNMYGNKSVIPRSDVGFEVCNDFNPWPYMIANADVRPWFYVCFVCWSAYTWFVWPVVAAYYHWPAWGKGKRVNWFWLVSVYSLCLLKAIQWLCWWLYYSGTVLDNRSKGDNGGTAVDGFLLTSTNKSLNQALFAALGILALKVTIIDTYKSLTSRTQIRKNPVYVALFATVCLIIPFALETMVRDLQSWAGCDTWKTFAVLVLFTMFTTFLYLFGRMLATRCFTCTC